MIKNKNKAKRQAIEIKRQLLYSAMEEIVLVLMNNKGKDTNDYYLKNAIRLISKAIESE